MSETTQTLYRARFIAAGLCLLLVLTAWIDTEWQSRSRPRKDLKETSGSLIVRDEASRSSRGSETTRQVLMIESTAGTFEFSCWNTFFWGSCQTGEEPAALNRKRATAWWAEGRILLFPAGPVLYELEVEGNRVLPRSREGMSPLLWFVRGVVVFLLVVIVRFGFPRRT